MRNRVSLLIGITMALLCTGATSALAAGTISVSPDTGLNRAGQNVTVTGSDWTPGDTVTLQLCREAPGHGRCLGNGPTMTPNASGAFSTSMSVTYTLSGTSTSCEDPYCEILAFSNTDFSQTSAPIHFAGSSSTNATPSAGSSGSISFGSSATDSATVSGNAVLGTPTGTLNFFVCGPEPSSSFCDSGTAISGNPQTLTAGTGNTANATSGRFTPSAPGKYCFKAVYSGNSSYGASYDDNFTQCFFAKLPSTTTSTPSSTWIPLGGQITDSAVVTGSTAGGSPTRAVWFWLCGPLADASATCTTGGNAWLNVSNVTPGANNTATASTANFTPGQPGRYCFRAEYRGDDRYFESADSSPSECFQVGGYPRPKGATPIRFSLVPAFQECTSSNRQHGAPLAFPSCNPPAQESGQLTIGAPDANGKLLNSTGVLSISTIEGDPATPADESDVHFDTKITDVRRKSDLADYTGELQAQIVLRVTDKYSGSSLADTATVNDFPFAFTVPCTGTTDANIGSTCSVTTSADAVLGDPNAAKEGTRAVWQLGQANVFDGGPDGVASTPDNTVFETQGVFVP